MTPILKIPGVGPALAKALHEHGLKSAEDVKGKTPDELAKIPSIGANRSKRIIAAADLLLSHVVDAIAEPVKSVRDESITESSALKIAEAARVAAEKRAAKAEAKAAKSAKKADALAVACAKAKEKAKRKANKHKKKAKKAIAKEKLREKEILAIKSEKKKKKGKKR